jgi:hypothetical protein
MVSFIQNVKNINIYRESRVLVTRHFEEGEMKVTAKRNYVYAVSFWVDENIFKLDGGNHCIMMNLNFLKISPHCHFSQF